MKKIKIIALLTAVALIATLSLVSCTQGDKASRSAESGDLLAEIHDRGEIIIGTEGTWAPWTYHDENERLTGYDVEVARLVAEKLGVTATFVEGEWDGLLAGLNGGRYDMMANGVDVTPERQNAYAFSTPYAYNRTAIIVRAENEQILTLEDLSGKRTANTISSTYAQVAEQYGAKVTGVDDLNQTMELLLSGRIDATLNSEVTFYDYLRARPNAPVKIAVLTDEATYVAFPIPKGKNSVTLVEAVNKALDELRQDGTLTELSNRFFGSDLTQGE